MLLIVPTVTLCLLLARQVVVHVRGQRHQRRQRHVLHLVVDAPSASTPALATTVRSDARTKRHSWLHVFTLDKHPPDSQTSIGCFSTRNRIPTHPL